MSSLIAQFKSSRRQTKYFILTLLIYMIALVWTTLQSYARLDYSRSDEAKDSTLENETTIIHKK